MFGKVKDDCAALTNESIEDEIFEMFATCRNGIACPCFGVFAVTYGDILMRSKLAIPALVVASLFGSTLIASAQTQTAPGASSEGTVNPGATPSKKMQHDKGMTTGSDTRGGANKTGTMNPSGQNNAGSGYDNMAAPKSGSKY
jgi:hypothetical protein